MKIFRPASLASILTILAAIGTAAGDATQGHHAIEQAIHRAMPSTRIDAIRPSPIAGLMEITAGRNVLYADGSGRWLLVGHLYDLETSRDVTAERIDALARLKWEELPLEAAVHYGQGPLRLAVFSDPDCPWCRKLHQALRDVKGIEVWEIMFPVTALHPRARDKAIRILCHPQPDAALTDVMAGRELKNETVEKDCIERAERRVDGALAYAHAHDIEGTPTLVSYDGRIRSGYLPPEQLKAWLEETPKQVAGHE